jgi:hypothetical protein
MRFGSDGQVNTFTTEARAAALFAFDQGTVKSMIL